ncbi:hypothetical protein KC19_VG277700 [Ceratodon purpureus]|uniref:Uncharacterized protein n=1 Tax=Ceratodon purpureus TaxID=3225 RepID=A0A8T0HV08_CERPU|nr:hypothetical protein KC19_VG277700 [Ceratodon purpureus]
MSHVHCIAQKLDHQFTYSRPLDINYLAKFLKCWKKYFIKSGGMRHIRCPVEVFTEWRKYWLIAEGKDESIQMTQMRKGKTHRTDNSPVGLNNYSPSNSRCVTTIYKSV